MRKSNSFVDANPMLGQKKTPKASQPTKATGLQDNKTHRHGQLLPQNLLNNGQQPGYKATNPEEHTRVHQQRNAKKVHGQGSSFITVTQTTQQMQRRQAQQSSSQEVVARRKDSNPTLRQPMRQANKPIGDSSMRGDSPQQISPNQAHPISPPPIQLGQTRLSEYTKLSVLGKGTYGEVHKCVHTPTGLIVAMKTYMFENVTNGINYSTMREISLLRQLVNHEQFVRLLDILEDDQGTTKNIHCIFEFCEKVLANELNKRDRALPTEQARHIIRDLLVAVDVLHGKMIMHRDIKPDNILLDSNGRLKLADFGLAKKASFLQRRKSNAIVSLWYRAPEIILGSEDYFLGVDMWSVGCIFAELMTKRPIFMCRNENEVLTRVFQLLGSPSEKHCSMYLGLPKWKKGLWGDQQPPGMLRQYFPDASPQAMDLLSKMLALDPSKRILAKEALNHPYFTNSPF